MTEVLDSAERGATKKLGPLPMWGWGVLLGVVIVGYLWYKGRASSTTTGTGTGGITTGVDPNAFDNAALYSGNNANAANATHATASQSQTTRTNGAWLRQGVQFETGKGRNALYVLRALQKFLTGTTLSEAQSVIVSDVIKHIGLPPKPPKTVSTVRRPPNGDNTAATPPTKPIRKGPTLSQAPATPDVEPQPRQALVSGVGHTMTTAMAGDSPATVSQRVYGMTTPFHAEVIRKANGIGTTDEFVPGQKVMVPHV